MGLRYYIFQKLKTVIARTPERVQGKIKTEAVFKNKEGDEKCMNYKR